MQDMLEAGLTPNVVTYTSLMVVLRKGGQYEKSIGMLSLMRAKVTCAAAFASSGMFWPRGKRDKGGVIAIRQRQGLGEVYAPPPPPGHVRTGDMLHPWISADTLNSCNRPRAVTFAMIFRPAIIPP